MTTDLQPLVPSIPAAPLILTGQTLTFTADPFLGDPDRAIRHERDGAVVIADGRIAAVGPRVDVLAQYGQTPVHSRGDDLIMAGFVDCHAHYPQLDIMASYGEALLEWLHRYTFPAELAFADGAHAAAIAEAYLTQALRHGTTSASVYATVHPQSVTALFKAAFARGMRLATGKVMMDREAPAGLLDTAQEGYDQSQALITAWHGRGRLSYAISPRFAITSSPAQLEAAGALWAAHPTTLMQTHLSETPAEIARVSALYPDALDYLAVYEAAGLVGPGANFGHAIHLTPRERAALADRGAGVSHCPTSNLFLGSGLFDLEALRCAEPPIKVGLASDIGAGSSLSMLATMKAAYEIARLHGARLHPIEAFHLATTGSAEVMGLSGEIGNLAGGLAADLIVLDLAATPLLARRISRAESISDVLFALMMLGDDRAVRETYVAGRLAHAR